MFVNLGGFFNSGQHITMPAGRDAFGLCTADLDQDGRQDIANTFFEKVATVHNASWVRLTYNRCTSVCGRCANVGLIRAGDFNLDGRVDGEDIQPFVNVYFDPTHAADWEYCTADMTRNCVLDVDDLQCFVRTLLDWNERCGAPCGGESSYQALPYAASSQAQASESTASPAASTTQQASTQPAQQDAPILALREWLRTNGPRAYPQLTDEEWREMFRSKAIELGVFPTRKGAQP